MMSKLSRAQMIAHNHQIAVTKHTELKNELFKLHKFLVEHSGSEHKIDDSENVIQDAIELIIKLTRS